MQTDRLSPILFWPLAAAAAILLAVTKPPMPILVWIAVVLATARYDLHAGWAVGGILAITGVIWLARRPIERLHKRAFDAVERRFATL